MESGMERERESEREREREREARRVKATSARYELESSRAETLNPT